MSDADDDLPPPWAKHPEIPSGSIGWRMGYGESWLTQWHDWLAKQPKDRPTRLAYLRRHPPAPRTWSRTVARVLEPHDREGDADDEDEDVDVDEPEPDDYAAANEALAQRLAAEGLVGDDVAMGAWEALWGEAPAAPWAASWHRGELGSMARYGGRELTFWARWCARRRDDGRLAAWLRSVPAPTPAWEPLRDAARDGTVPRGWQPASAWERAAVLVAAHAEAPPPWTLGEAPASLREDYADDSSYADAWCAWVYDSLDDRTSWRAYLERHGGVPAEWHDAIARAIEIGG